MMAGKQFYIGERTLGALGRFKAATLERAKGTPFEADLQRKSFQGWLEAAVCEAARLAGDVPDSGGGHDRDRP